MSATLQCLCRIVKHLYSKHDAVRVQQYYAGARRMLCDSCWMVLLSPPLAGAVREAMPTKHPSTSAQNGEDYVTQDAID